MKSAIVNKAMHLLLEAWEHTRPREEIEASLMIIIAPPKKVKKKLKPIPFTETEIYDKVKFKEAFPDWPKSKLKHYYESADSYSTEGHYYIDWKKAISNWASRDELQNRYVFTDVIAPQNGPILKKLND